MIDELNPTSENVESQVPEEAVQPENQEAAFDVETSDNVKQIRDYAKSLKTDLDKYKPSHEFVETKFGNLSNAELAANFYGDFAGEEFDPDKFLQVIGQLSPQRAKQLTDKLSSAEAQTLAKTEIEKIFGSKPTTEEISLFKKWKESGYNLGEGDDIPDALKVDSDGNPRSDEEIQFLRDLQRQVKENNVTNKAEAEATAQKEHYDQQMKVQTEINDFSAERLKVLENEFKLVGLEYNEKDTAEQRSDKDFVKSFILDGISGAFLKDSNAAKDYTSAIEHIEKGESLLARRFEPKIEAKLLEIFRKDAVTKMLEKFLQPKEQPELRPEINESGTPKGSETPTGRVTTDDLIKKLVDRGDLKLT